VPLADSKYGGHSSDVLAWLQEEQTPEQPQEQYAVDQWILDFANLFREQTGIPCITGLTLKLDVPPCSSAPAPEHQLFEHLQYHLISDMIWAAFACRQYSVTQRLVAVQRLCKHTPIRLCQVGAISTMCLQRQICAAMPTELCALCRH